MRIISKIVITCLVFALGSSFIFYARTPGLAQEPNGVTLRVFPEQIQGVIGQNVDVAVEVVDVADLYAIDILVGYDPRAVEVVDQDPDLDGVQVKLGEFLEPGFVIYNLADNNLGRLRLVMTQLNPAPPKDGTGALVVMTFKGKQVSTSSLVEVLSAKLASPAGYDIPIKNLENANLSVVTSLPGPTSTPFPAQNPGTPMPTPEPATPVPNATEQPGSPLTFLTTPSLLDLPAPTAIQPVLPTPTQASPSPTSTLPPTPSAELAALVTEPSPSSTAPPGNPDAASPTPLNPLEATGANLSTSEPPEAANQPAKTRDNSLTWFIVLAALVLAGGGSYIYMRKRNR